MRRSGGPEPCAACSSTSACGEQRVLLGGQRQRQPRGATAPLPWEAGLTWHHAAWLAAGLAPRSLVPNHLREGCQPPRATGALLPSAAKLTGACSQRRRLAQTPGAKAGHREGSRVHDDPPPQPHQRPGHAGLTCHMAAPHKPSWGAWLCPQALARSVFPVPRASGTAPRHRAHLDAADDSVVHPARVGQGRALHQDLHGLDGTRWAQVVHGHLGQGAQCHHNHHGQGRGRRQPQDPSPWARGSSRAPVPTPCTPNPFPLQPGTGKRSGATASPAGHIRAPAQPGRGHLRPAWPWWPLGCGESLPAPGGTRRAAAVSPGLLGDSSGCSWCHPGGFNPAGSAQGQLSLPLITLVTLVL